MLWSVVTNRCSWVFMKLSILWQPQIIGLHMHESKVILASGRNHDS